MPKSRSIIPFQGQHAPKLSKRTLSPLLTGRDGIVEGHRSTGIAISTKLHALQSFASTYPEQCLLSRCCHLLAPITHRTSSQPTVAHDGKQCQLLAFQQPPQRSNESQHLIHEAICDSSILNVRQWLQWGILHVRHQLGQNGSATTPIPCAEPHTTTEHRARHAHGQRPLRDGEIGAPARGVFCQRTISLGHHPIASPSLRGRVFALPWHG